MASVKKITMREYNGTDYDTLYPKTIASQVDGVYNKEESISASTRTALGLATNATPDAALAEIARQLSERMTLLWENAKPTAVFVAQNLTFNGLQNYDFVLFDYHSTDLGLSNGGCAICSTRIGAAGVLDGYMYGNYWFDFARNLSISENSITFEDSYSYGILDNGATIKQKDNGHNVPMKIYGLKA